MKKSTPVSKQFLEEVREPALERLVVGGQETQNKIREMADGGS
jgi:hypothetical protein